MRAGDLTGLYQKGDWLLFGAETTGLPEEVRGVAQKLLKCSHNREGQPSGRPTHTQMRALLQLQSALNALYSWGVSRRFLHQCRQVTHHRIIKMHHSVLISSVLCMQAYTSIKESSGGVLRIPIAETHVRSLNLAVSAGVALYESIRQLDGPH